MAISVPFVLKHVRPFGDGFEPFCSVELIDILHNNLNFSFGDIVAIFAQWHATSRADPHANSNMFVAAAKDVAMARWTELYPTDTSSLMFLDQDQLASLSLAGANAGPNAQFNWNYGADLPICVSIKHDTGAHHIVWDAKGCVAGTDNHGLVNHFVRLL